jgi:NAD(P)-dependent dehydrogenase (short-subunit alcohol dehydrogenase family)
MPDLSSKVFIVTGASRGIGFATARLLADDGARVALFARDADAVAEAARSISQSAIGGASIGGTAIGVAVDVGEHGPMLAAFQSVWDAFGRLDGVVNNAGATMVCRIEHLSEAAVMLQVKANFLGVVYGSQAAIPYLRRTGGGRIVNVTSATVRHPEEFPFLSIYAATKAAAERFSEELRQEVKGDGIGVTVFSPGSTDTAFGQGADPAEALAALEKWREMGPDSDGLLTAETVGRAIADCFALPAGAAFDFVELRPNRPTPKALRV